MVLVIKASFIQIGLQDAQRHAYVIQLYLCPDTAVVVFLFWFTFTKMVNNFI